MSRKKEEGGKDHVLFRARKFADYRHRVSSGTPVDPVRCSLEANHRLQTSAERWFDYVKPTKKDGGFKSV
ncbi:MAG: hypothetical protein ACREVN_07845 [Gammaproteobacteria bacterium]